MLGSWNTWGINSPRKCKAVRDWIHNNHLQIVGLIEPKVSLNNLPVVVKTLNLPGWDFVSNATSDESGRILIGWNATNFSLSSIHCTSQWITCDVCNYSTTETMRITFVYGRNTPAERRPLWDYISSHSLAFSHTPWILLGDFNSIMHSDQREGGATSWLSHSEDFQQAAHLAQLIVIPYQGLKFTWHNGQNSAQNIQKKLDWVLGNSSLIQCWPSTSATFLPRTVSDHSAAVVMFWPPMKPKSFQFKFLNLWTSRDEFLPTVSQAWNIEVLGDPMMRLAAKLKSVKVALKAFHKLHSSHISSRVLEAKKNWE